MDLLRHLPKAQSLELAVSRLDKPLDVPDEKLLDEIFGEDCIDRPDAMSNTENDDLGTHYARDCLLKAVPDIIFNQLKTLKMTYCFRDWRNSHTSDVLQYANDIRNGTWRVCPFGSKDADGHWIVQDEETHWKGHLWLQARAAVYWNHDMPQGAALWARQGLQWSTWAREWRKYKDEMSRERPRTWEEMFDEDGEVRPGCGAWDGRDDDGGGGASD